MLFNLINQIVNEKLVLRNDVSKNLCAFFLSNRLTFEFLNFFLDIHLHLLGSWKRAARVTGAASRTIWRRRAFSFLSLCFKTLKIYCEIDRIEICSYSRDGINFMDAIEFQNKTLVLLKLILLSFYILFFVDLFNFKIL